MKYVQMFYGDGKESSHTIQNPNYDANETELLTFIREAPKEVRLLTDECRRMYPGVIDGTVGKSAYNHRKSFLPQALFTCLASGRKKTDAFCLTGMYAIDIDEADNPGINVIEMKDTLFESEFVRLVYLSPSGRGLRVVVDINTIGFGSCTNVEQLQVFSYQAHATLAKHYKEKHGLTIDPSCKNVNRLMYLAHDPDARWKAPQSTFTVDTSLEVTPEPEREQGTQPAMFTRRGGGRDHRIILQIVEECERRGVSITQTYPAWLAVAMALKNTLGNEGFGYFDRLSRLDRNMYSEQGVQKQWISIHRTPPAGPPITIGTLIMMAREAGLTVDTTTHEEEKLTPKQVIREWLGGRYVFGINSMTHMVYYKTPDEEHWRRFDWDFMPFEFLCTIETDRGLQTPLSNVEAVVRDMAAKNRYHPIREYLESLVWDGVDRIKALCDSISTDDDEAFRVYFTKWYVGMIACAMGQGANDKALILQGNQGDGKTYFFEKLLPRQKGLKLTDVLDSFTPSSKDDRIKATEYMLIVFDEMSSYNKNELGELKSMITANEFEVRIPYARSIVTREKSATFAGCVNNDQFLRDATGDRRYLVFKMLSRDWAAYDAIDKEQLLAQFVHLWKTGTEHRLTRLEYDMVIKRNRTHFTATTTDEEMLGHLYPDDRSFMTWRDIAREYQETFNYRFTAQPATLGAYMKKLGILRKQKKINGRNEWGYFCSFTPPTEQMYQFQIDNPDVDYKV